MARDSLADYMRRIINMKRLTNVELVNTYWQQAHQIANTGRLGFIIRGNISWKSNQPEGIFSNSLWLKSNSFDPMGKHIATDPLRTYLQWYENLYEIWGTLNVEIDPNDVSTSKLIIEQSLNKTTSLTNTMSLLFGASLRWFPARYAHIRHIPMPPLPDEVESESWDCIPLRRSQDEHITRVLDDKALQNELIPLVNDVESLPSKIKPIINTAIDWHAHANRFSLGLTRFLHYWSSIELLGHFFYKRLRPSCVQRKTRQEKKEEILALLEKGVTHDNCLNIIQKCDGIREPSARTKILAFLGIVSDKERMEEALFKRDDMSGKSLYEIRNDIAHGNIAERDFETVENLRYRLFDAQNISREIILSSITSVEKISKYMR